MKKLFLILICLGLGSFSPVMADVIYVAGDVSGTWSADTVIVTAEVRVPPGNTLTIEPGVEVLFFGYCKFIVDQSTLLAVGTLNDSILFDEFNPGNHWKGIRFLSASSDCHLEYCHLTHGSASGGGEDNNGGAIYCSNSSPTIIHSTIDSCSATLNGAAIYCTLNSNPTISDNNINGSFTGSYIPQWLGTIATINANGDSCDTYFNIFLDPLFEDPVNGNYQITWANYLVPDSTRSPCIDAGDPNSPLDPDSTVADMGALYFDQRRIVTITLTPYNPPIIIPKTGGDFAFNIAVTNNDTSSQSFNIWCMATLPDGSFYGPVLGPVNITMPAGASNNRDRTQEVPPSAPAGDYTYTAYVGIYPDTIWSSDSFPFEKLEAPDTLWTQTFGGTSCDCGYSVRQTDDGGYIIAGVTHSYGSGDNDIWLIKTDAVGDCTWSQTFGGNGCDVGRWAEQTMDGGYIVVGCSNSYTVLPNDYDVYLIKTDEFGNEMWSHTFGDSAGEFGECVQQTQDGGYIISGQAAGITTVWDVLLLKTDQSGNEIWTHTFNVNYADCGETVRQTQDGGYIIAGWTDSGNKNALLIKTDGMGYETWHHTYGGGGFDTGECGQQTQDGGYVIAGWTNSFGAGSYDVYLIKTDESGNELWSQTYGGQREDNGLSVYQTQDSGYIITGWTKSFGAGAEDVYLIKTDESGNEQWTQTYGGSSQDIGWSVQQTADGGYIIAGYTYSFGAGSNDVYLIRIGGETVMNAVCADFMVEEGIINIPLDYSLFQNHPNPFNSVTKLTFDLPKAGDVSLIIYDIQGREVARLFDGFYSAGTHETIFDGSQLSSGIYFACLKDEGFSQTRKILLVK